MLRNYDSHVKIQCFLSKSMYLCLLLAEWSTYTHICYNGWLQFAFILLKHFIKEEWSTYTLML